MDRVGFGVIGAGLFGENHARVYSRLPGVELVAIADLGDYAFGDRIPVGEWLEEMAPDSPYWASRDFSSAVGDACILSFHWLLELS